MSEQISLKKLLLLIEKAKAKRFGVTCSSNLMKKITRPY